MQVRSDNLTYNWVSSKKILTRLTNFVCTYDQNRQESLFLNKECRESKHDGKNVKVEIIKTCINLTNSNSYKLCSLPFICICASSKPFANDIEQNPLASHPKTCKIR